ncbi:MAG: glycoside hydrolase family 130 protein [Saprospiraceae bacterium]
MIPVHRTNIRLKADVRKVLPRFLDFGNPARFEPVIQFVLGLEDAAAASQLQGILKEFEHRHFDLETVFLEHYERLSKYVPTPVSLEKRLLIGAYFTHEYSIQAAALFNPSIVPHPDQSGLAPGELRFVLSLRATGEGHISSIAFLSGIIGAELEIRLESADPKLARGKYLPQQVFQKSGFARRAPMEAEGTSRLLEQLPEEFFAQEAMAAVNALEAASGLDMSRTKASLAEYCESHYELEFPKDAPLSSRILFPASRSESNGMEDARFVRFEDEKGTRFLGTYTAYNGRAIAPHLIETSDFQNFKIRPIAGKAASDKGMALFPEKVKGRYAMVGRQGGRSLSIMYSDDLYLWDSYAPLQHPQRDWEMLQMGNCGSPVKTPQGWLLLTHAVGAMRKYVLSISLLDLHEPERVIASLEQPLMSPDAEEREGYVPNVLYTCGMMAHHGHLVIPYAMSDSAIGFAKVETAAVLEALLRGVV